MAGFADGLQICRVFVSYSCIREMMRMNSAAGFADFASIAGPFQAALPSELPFVRLQIVVVLLKKLLSFPVFLSLFQARVNLCQNCVKDVHVSPFKCIQFYLIQ